ncbi:apolipoprotein N-acyltransferase [Robbsia andropogonis]|uniref:apolipoprotein N-acyltransferase n=1 Tax=Robbsia andropogonis TaxID=28092 RepID=UPI002A6A931B|nr:apolipoprotein N-acyltransferase [Robbsia andropogonis]
MRDETTDRAQRPTSIDTSAAARRGRLARMGAALGTIGWRRTASALGLGVLSTLTFAPVPQGGWLQLPLLAVLFGLLALSRNRLSALITGFLFGVGNFVSGLYWLYISMHHYGGMPAVMAGAAVVLFAAYLALYPALACGAWFVATPLSNDPASVGPLRITSSDAVTNSAAAHATSSDVSAADLSAFNAPIRGLPWRPLRLDRTPSRPVRARRIGRLLLSAVLFGATWALGEWLRGTVFTGFPWLSIGYAQVDGPFEGFAALVGVYGVGFITATCAALLTQCVFGVRRHANLTGVVCGSTALVLVALGLGGRWLHFTHPDTAPLTVRLLQGDIGQSIKFSQAGLDHSLALYQQLITAKAADLIVTPETALPIVINDTPERFAQATRAFVDRTGSSLLLGAAGVTDRDGHLSYTNSTFGLSPGQSLLYRYDKHHLVPFGEFVPWGFRWFVQLMQIPLGDFARGAPVQPPFIVKGERFAVNICYEDLFGEEIAANLRGQAMPAGVLVNSTNLAWFGDSIALDQHLQISRMRALEMQRPVIRATNTGTTAAIDANGDVQARLPAETVGALDATVQGMQGTTPYIRFGNVPVLVAALVILLGAFAGGRKRRD